MITAADAEFHPPDGPDPTRGETTFVDFYDHHAQLATPATAEPGRLLDPMARILRRPP